MSIFALLSLIALSGTLTIIFLGSNAPLLQTTRRSASRSCICHEHSRYDLPRWIAIETDEVEGETDTYLPSFPALRCSSLRGHGFVEPNLRRWQRCHWPAASRLRHFLLVFLSPLHPSTLLSVAMVATGHAITRPNVHA